MSNPSTHIIASVTALVSELARCTVEGLAAATGEAGLASIEKTEKELRDAAKAIATQFDESIKVATARATEVRSNMNEHALSQVVALLNSGTLSMADIVARLNVAPLVPAVADAPAAEILVAQPAPVSQPTVPAPETPAVVDTTPPAVQSMAQSEPLVVAPAPAPAIVCAELLPLPTQRLTAPYKTPVLFRDPVSGAGWSGRGPTPKWFADLCVNGKTKADFRVGAQVVTVPATSPAAADVFKLTGSSAAADTDNAKNPLDLELDDILPPAAKTDDIGDDIGGDASFDGGDFSISTDPTVDKTGDDLKEFLVGFENLTEISLGSASSTSCH